MEGRKIAGELNAVKVESQILKISKDDRKLRLHDTDLIYSLKEAYCGKDLESALSNGSQVFPNIEENALWHHTSFSSS